ncbi:DNA methyltransferase [Legionella tunisiensis]|uniref:DNA methyltransferase n=1 Tax=Legionella tunisiensis TaxID=1034944 RepID=UPI0006881141|nr:DNA methyltransferase [Legionella tunisiensis]
MVEANYCITLDLVPRNLIPEIIGNQRQREEWKNIFSIELDKLDKDFNTMDLDIFLKTEGYTHLVVDTKYMEEGFKNKLLSSMQNIDETLNGELINSDNFHALSLLMNKYEHRIKCIYIDPPYNTSSTPILYKNEYKDSSWLSLMDSRISFSKSLLSGDGVKTIAIDDTELSNLGKYLEDKFIDYRISKITVVHNPKGSITKDFNRVHEYALFITHEDSKNCIARTLEENKNLRKLRRWGENSLRTERKLSFYPIYIKDRKITRVGEVPSDDFHPSGRNVHLSSGEIEVWPIDQHGIERRWNFGLDSIVDNLSRIAVEDIDDSLDLFVTHELTVPKTVWSGGQFDAGKYGNSLLINILGEKNLISPNPFIP